VGRRNAPLHNSIVIPLFTVSNMNDDLRQALKHVHQLNVRFGLAVQKLKMLYGRSWALERLHSELQCKYERGIESLAESFGKEARIYDLSLEYKVKDFEPRVRDLQTLRGEFEELTKALGHIDVEITSAYRQIGEKYYEIMRELESEQDTLNEKQKIERASAEGFLRLYNTHFNTDFHIEALGDAPDVRCQDPKGEELNLEITLTEDRPRDIQAALGRSNHKSPEVAAEHNKRVAAGEEKLEFSSMSGNVLDQVADRIKAKQLKSYGANTALVIRDTSGADWDWEYVIEDLKQKIGCAQNPFDKGIWILNLEKTKLYQVL